MNQRHLPALCFCLALGWAAADTVRAQFTVTILGVGPNNSHGFGVAGGQQVGIQTSHASVWAGSAGSLADLNPAGAFSSVAYASNGTQQGGRANFANVNGADHAGIWSGTAASFVDLNPGVATTSVVLAMTATSQGGSAQQNAVIEATIWQGSAASAVSLHPAGAIQSEVFAMSATQQGGYATIGGDPHAALWSGTAGSFVDLNPAGAVGSYVHALSGPVQAGAAYFSSDPHAAVWSGTAGTFVDLDPGGTDGTVIYGLAGSYGAGVALYGGETHAVFWDTGGGGFMDLQSFITGAVGGSYTSSLFRGAAIQGNTLYLIGDAIDPLGASHVAILVTTAIPEPNAGAFIGGLAGLALASGWRWRRKKAACAPGGTGHVPPP